MASRASALADASKLHHQLSHHRVVLIAFLGLPRHARLARLRQILGFAQAPQDKQVLHRQRDTRLAKAWDEVVFPEGVRHVRDECWRYKEIVEKHDELVTPHASMVEVLHQPTMTFTAASQLHLEFLEARPRVGKLRHHMKLHGIRRVDAVLGADLQILVLHLELPGEFRNALVDFLQNNSDALLDFDTASRVSHDDPGDHSEHRRQLFQHARRLRVSFLLLRSTELHAHWATEKQHLDDEMAQVLRPRQVVPNRLQLCEGVQVESICPAASSVPVQIIASCEDEPEKPDQAL
mmetsp:Transcript_22644/g.63147  ORF Transcript_22644/g.63147 Transcript_22644/m.63147 type:complete len:293 (+) Transcript_22644:167-1045(+)